MKNRSGVAVLLAVGLACTLSGCEFPVEGQKPGVTQQSTGSVAPETISEPALEVEALNFLVQPKTSAWPKWQDAVTHAVILEAIPYGARHRVSAFASKKPPFNTQLELVSGGRTLVKERVDFNRGGLHYLFLLGNESGAQGLYPTLVEVPIPSGKEEGIRFLHAAPEHHLVDVYLNRKLAAENQDFMSLTSLLPPAEVGPISEITIVLRGKTPTFDALQDELHLRLEKPLEEKRLLLVYAFKSGGAQAAFNNDTVYIYKN
jgi:hypothetical protein